MRRQSVMLGLLFLASFSLLPLGLVGLGPLFSLKKNLTLLANP